jgi:hypothetical protein
VALFGPADTYFVVGMEKGWFKDVGISIDPQPYEGAQTGLGQIIAFSKIFG